MKFQEEWRSVSGATPAFLFDIFVVANEIALVRLHISGALDSYSS